MLVARVGRQIALHQKRVEPVVHHDAMQVLEYRELVLAVRVHGVHEVLRGQLGRIESPAQVPEGEVVGLAHTLVDVVHQHSCAGVLG